MKYKYRIIKVKQVEDGYNRESETFNPVMIDRYLVQYKPSGFMSLLSNWRNTGYGSFKELQQAESYMQLQIAIDIADTYSEVIKNI